MPSLWILLPSSVPLLSGDYLSPSNLQNLIKRICTCMGIVLSTGSWAAYQWLHPWGKMSRPSLVAINSLPGGCLIRLFPIHPGIWQALFVQITHNCHWTYKAVALPCPEDISQYSSPSSVSWIVSIAFFNVNWPLVGGWCKEVPFWAEHSAITLGTMTRYKFLP